MADVPALTWRQILALKPCAQERNRARFALKRALGAAYKERPLTVADAIDAGVELRSVFWLLSMAAAAAPGPETDITRRLWLFSADLVAASGIPLAVTVEVGGVFVSSTEARYAGAPIPWQRERLKAWFSAEEPEPWPPGRRVSDEPTPPAREAIGRVRA